MIIGFFYDLFNNKKMIEFSVHFIQLDFKFFNYYFYCNFSEKRHVTLDITG